MKSLKKSLISFNIVYTDSPEIQTSQLRDILMLLYVLDKSFPVSATEIEDKLGISQPKVSVIGSRLIALGLLKKEKEGGNRVVYSPTDKGALLKARLQKENDNEDS